jgi:uncharacterized protein YycO
MVQSPDQLKRGDVLLYSSQFKDNLFNGDLVALSINFFQNGGFYYHCSMWDGSHQIESVLDKGVSKSVPIKENLQFIDIFRFSEKENEISKAIEFMESKVGSKYDFMSYPETWFRSVFARVYGWKNFASGKPVTNNDKTWYCSELVATAIYYATGREPLPGTNPANTTPDDLRKGWLVKID